MVHLFNVASGVSRSTLSCLKRSVLPWMVKTSAGGRQSCKNTGSPATPRITQILLHALAEPLSRRNTRANILKGYLLTIAATITMMGTTAWLEKLAVGDQEGCLAGALQIFLEATLAVPYRGQVWPLESAFGEVAAISDADQHRLKKAELITEWVGPRGDVQGTCMGSTAIEALIDVLAPVAADGGCYHAKLFLDTLDSAGSLLGDPKGDNTKWFVARWYKEDASSLDGAEADNSLRPVAVSTPALDTWA